MNSETDVKQAAPLFRVTNIEHLQAYALVAPPASHSA
jgi:hypothetical protein